MTTTTIDLTDRITALLRACITSAREQGWDGEDGEYEYTAEDLQAVTAALGLKPSKEEWVAAFRELGLGPQSWIGSAHYDHETRAERLADMED